MKLRHRGRLLLLVAALLGSCGLAWMLLSGVGAAKLLLFGILVLFLGEFFYRLDRWMGKKEN